MKRGTNHIAEVDHLPAESGTHLNQLHPRGGATSASCW